MSYEYFASVYDIMMSDVPYDSWVDYIEEIFIKHQLQPKMILDLGCGTGTMTTKLAKNGYEMIGVDISPEMLFVAKEKADKEKLDILYLCQSMTELDLYGTVDCVLSICDSLNYLLETDELFETFCNVNNYLNPGGLFIFDLNMESKFEEMGDQTFAEVFDTCAYIWENEYNHQMKINEYALTLFIENDGVYKRFEEMHYERAYSIEEITRLLEKSGLKLEAVYEELTFNTPNATSHRVYFVAREISKKRETC